MSQSVEQKEPPRDACMTLLISRVIHATREKHLSENAREMIWYRELGVVRKRGESKIEKSERETVSRAAETEESIKGLIRGRHSIRI